MVRQGGFGNHRDVGLFARSAAALGPPAGKFRAERRFGRATQPVHYLSSMSANGAGVLRCPGPMASASEPSSAAASLRDLANRALKGDEWAFERIYQRLGNGLERFLSKRLGGATEHMEELAQRTWVEVWRAMQTGRYDPDRSALTTYVYAVGHKVWLQYYRHSRNAPVASGQVEEMSGALLEEVVDVSDSLGLAELLDALRQCLSESGKASALTEEERQVAVALSEGETERTLAARLGIAASTVHARKTSAFAKLRRCLAQKGYG